MNAWWHSLSGAQQFFYAIAILASVILIGRMILGLIGLDHHADGDVGDDHGSGLGVLSLQSIATFLVGFGWVGALWLSRGYGILIAVVSGVIVGVAMMAGIIFLMRGVLRLQDSGTLDYHNAIGLTGTVYCVVPPERQPGGQVEVLLQGRAVFADALTDSAQALKTGSSIRVVSVVSPSILLVEAA